MTTTATLTAAVDSSVYAQYSPLFASGLLSGRNTPEDDSSSSSRSGSAKRCRQHKEYRDSLPVTVDTASVSLHAAVRSSTDSASDSAMFLTFAPRRRQTEEGRSFLSLDLAESQSMRSMSLRRKDTITTRRSTAFFALGRSEPSSPAPLSPTPRLPELKFSQFGIPPVSALSSKLRRSSRETLNLPSPKPAPSSSLPAPPPSLSGRRASKLTLTLSTCLSTAITVTSSISPSHRPSRSEPSFMMSPSLCSSPILSPGQSYFMFSPVSPTAPAIPPPLTAASSVASAPETALPRTPASAPAAMPLRATPSFRSVASVNTRQRNRSAALAVLEGRGGRGRPIARPGNFMSMSDDEDELEHEAPGSVREAQCRLLEVLHEDEDVVVSPSTAAALPVSASVCPLARPDSSALGGSVNAQPRSVSGGAASWSRSGSSASPTKRSRRNTLESFLSPLANFIDLNLDDDRSMRSWRSFVEISS